MKSPVLVVAALVAIAGCGRSELLELADSSIGDVGTVDATSPPPDGHARDSSSHDSGAEGTSAVDGGAADGGSTDGGPSDAGPADVSPVDSGSRTADPDDSGFDSGDASDAGSPPSCAPGGPGMTNCGDGGIGNESCCTSLEVTGGAFYRTYTNDGGGPTAEADPASVSGFRLDEYEVTVGRFRQFVTAWNDGYEPLPGSGKHAHLNGGLGLAWAGGDAGAGYEPGWVASDDGNIQPTNANLSSDPYATWTPLAGNNENLPIDDVNWAEAYAFCIWDGGFLPSEAEWEYAAVGGAEQREYPWGATPPGAANQYAIYDCYYGSPLHGGCKFGVSNLAPVGTPTLGAGLWGQLDLGSNVNEWNLDWYAAYVEPCADCAYLTPSGARVNRGGSFWIFALPESRNGDPPTERGAYLGFGFRCARVP
jgi:sulfatase modifying factor 1